MHPLLETSKICQHLNENFIKPLIKIKVIRPMIYKPNSRPQKHRNTVALLLANEQTIAFIETSTFNTLLLYLNENSFGDLMLF